MSKTVLVVEDDPDIRALLAYTLETNAFQVETLSCLDQGLEKVRRIRPDLILLDVMLPDGDGFSFCQQIRQDATLAPIPVLFLTARSEEVDRILGLEIGGDDYITKPFSPRELLARVKAHLRRQEGPEPPPTLDLPLRLDRDACEVSLDGRRIRLTATEFRLLEFLMANPGRVFSREQLLRSIWGDGWHVSPRNVDVHIRRLRESIEDSPKEPQWIRTVRGFGYRFEIPA